MENIQRLLDESIPVTRITRQIWVTEGAIRYHIRSGHLKKRSLAGKGLIEATPIRFEHCQSLPFLLYRRACSGLPWL